MMRLPARILAAVLTTAGAAGVLVFGGWLTLDAIDASYRRTVQDARLEVLTEQSQEDPTRATALQEAFEAHTAWDVERDRRVEQLSWTLLAATALLIVSGKWLHGLLRAGPTVPADVRARCAAWQSGNGDGTVADMGGEVAAQPAAEDDVDVAEVDAIIARVGRAADKAIPLLHALQERFHYLPRVALRRVCEQSEITPAQLTSVASFYSQFRRTPRGEHLITVCHGTACHVAGAERLTDELRRQLRIGPEADTDAQREFTIQQVPCLGCCTLAPVVQTDGVTHGHVSAGELGELIHECRCGDGNGQATERPEDELAAGAPAGEPAGEIRLGMGSCCVANGSGAVHDALESALAQTRIHATVKRVGCVGMCHQTPFIEIHQSDGEPTIYSRVQPEQAGAIVRRHFRARGVGARLRNAVNGTVSRLRDKRPARLEGHTIELRDPPVAAFLGSQEHIATEHCGELDPLDLAEYERHDGFAALRKAVGMTPAEIVAEVRASGLRGRGGAGFPTAEKWEIVQRAAGTEKYIICNGDEGDPGAFMDRMLMESYPYRIVEGVAIAALATGASEAVFYIRAEYPLAVQRIEAAIRECSRREIIGDDLLGSGRSLRVRVVRGAGAFVCGEETALIASLEGRRGAPRLRPPYPAEAGLRGRPTLVNNVETFAVVPWILRHGGAAFAARGTERSSGTKVFALAGKVARGGLIEVPMGITIRQIVEEIGGGIRVEETAAGVRERNFKAVQIGGPSGGCVPAELADTPVDYEALAERGAIMGSGGLVVLDETDCMVDMARYFLSFTQGQSCGKCTPCRVGTRRMLEILERLCGGEGREADLEALESLVQTIQVASLCGLGQTAPNPVLTTLRYYREEYEAHLRGECPAGKCAALVRYEVTEDCTGCTLCAQQCPAGAIELRPYVRHVIDVDKCTRCDVCRVGCPEGAIRVR